MSDTTTATTTTTTTATPLPTLQTWSLLGHRSVGDLVISTSPSGVVSGTMFGNPVSGFWDKVTKRLTVVRVIADAFEQCQFFRGYSFSASFGGATHTFLTGDFEAGSKAGGREEQHTFGWLAVLRGSGPAGAAAPGDPSQHLLDVLGAVPPSAPWQVGSVSGAFSWDSTMVMNGYTSTLALRSNLTNQTWHDADAWVEGMIGNDPGTRVNGFLRHGDNGGDLTLLRAPKASPIRGDGLQLISGHPVELQVGTKSSGVVFHGWAGQFTALAGTGATPGRTEYGWFATRLVQGKAQGKPLGV